MNSTPVAESDRIERAAELNEPAYETFQSQGHAEVVATSDVSKCFATARSMLCHCLITVFTCYILYLSGQKLVLFSWHPACMTVGAFLLMAEAIMAMSPSNYLTSKLKRQSRVRLHFILQAAAAFFMFAGFLAIFINKNIHNKNHFQTWHALVGLATVILVAVTASGGVIALYAIRLKRLMKPAQIKFLHNVIGILTFILGVVTIILGLFTGWFKNNATYSAQVICSIVVVFAAILALESAIKSAIARFKNIYL